MGLPCKQARKPYLKAGAAFCAAAGVIILHAGTAHARVLPSPRPPETALVSAASQPGGLLLVQPGDSLSSIARRVYGEAAAWPVLYWANRDKIRDPDVIGTGLALKVPPLPASIPPPPQRPATVPAAARTVSTTGYRAPSSSFEQCVIARESGGNAQVMNSSGHYGLYQFSESTWVAYGGRAADFGHASAAEQHQVFANAVARGGEDNWSPYDGCSA